MGFADFLVLRGEFALVEFFFGRPDIAHQFKRLADVVEVDDVDDDLGRNAVLRDEDRTSGLGVAREARRHGLPKGRKGHHVIGEAHGLHRSFKYGHEISLFEISFAELYHIMYKAVKGRFVFHVLAAERYNVEPVPSSRWRRNWFYIIPLCASGGAAPCG